MRIFALLLVLLLWQGCGYKPAKRYVRSVLGPKVYTEVVVDLRDPQNSVLIKDALNQAILRRFSQNLVPKSHADTIIEVRMKYLYFTPLEYDANGYVIYYRTKVVLDCTLRSSKGVRHIQTSGLYDFPIEPNSVITDTMRYIAIKEAANKALDRFISRLSFQGAR